jgi:hypothetical protein
MFTVFWFNKQNELEKLFKMTICQGMWTVKCTEKRFIPLLPPWNKEGNMERTWIQTVTLI